MHAAERRSRPSAEDPRRVVEARRDLAEARVHRLQADREEAHHVGEDEAGRGAGEQQPEGPAERALERGHQGVVGPGEREQHAHRDHRARQRVAHRGQLGCHPHGGGAVQTARVGQQHREQGSHRGGGAREGAGVPEKRGEIRRDLPRADRGDRPPRELAHREQEREREHAHAGARRAGGPPPGEAHRLHPRPAPPALGEAGAAARVPLEQEQARGEEEQHAGELGGREAVEHPVPDPIDRLGEGAVAEARDGAEVGEGLHHREGHPCHQSRARHGHRDAEERAGARAPQHPGSLHGGGALLAKSHARQQVHIGIEDQRHHDHDPRVGADLGQPRAGAEPAAQRTLQRPRVFEEADEREADHVGRHGQRQDQRPFEHAAPGEAVVHDEPGESAPHHQGAGADSGQQQQGLAHQLEELGAPEMEPHVARGNRERGDHRRDGHREHRRDAHREPGPEGRRRRPPREHAAGGPYRHGRPTCSPPDPPASSQPPGTRRPPRCWCRPA